MCIGSGTGCGTRPTDGGCGALSLLYLCALVQGAGPAQRMGLRRSSASLFQDFYIYVHRYRVRDQPNEWGCGAPEQDCCKPSVPMCTGEGCGTSTTYRGCSAPEHAFCYPSVPRMCTGAGYGTSPKYGVAALLNKLVQSLLYLCALVQGAGPAKWMEVTSLLSMLIASLLYLVCVLVQGTGPAQRMALRHSSASLFQDFLTYVRW
jgi:hypothetical protein